MSNDRTFAIFDVSYLPVVDFSTVLETSQYTVGKSLDGTKTFVKWVGEKPHFFQHIPDAEFLSYEDMMATLNTPEWRNPLPLS